MFLQDHARQELASRLERLKVAERKDSTAMEASKLRANLRAELARVEAALSRIDEGVWGTCGACGRPIGPQRLLARPETDLCADCLARTS